VYKSLQLLIIVVVLTQLSFIYLGQPYTATAYSLKGRTASGEYVRRGIVAADTRLHKLGSKIKVNAGSYSGIYKVADTGRKIRGTRIDIWMPHREAVKFGRRKVYVLKV
jgi:3D (Asp-Asp-Asp) domain-containing protein